METTPSRIEPDDESTSSAISAASAPFAPSAAPVETTPLRSEPDEDHTVSLPMPPLQPTASFAKRFGLNLGSATTVETLRVAGPRAKDHGGGVPRFKPCALPPAVESLDLPHYAYRLAASLLEWPRTASRCPSNTAAAQIEPAPVILTPRRVSAAALGTGPARRAVTRPALHGRHRVAPHRQREE
jgi:hypothetical protein